jgi:hypothetical protein
MLAATTFLKYLLYVGGPFSRVADGLHSFEMRGLSPHFTLFIHFRIGPVTEVSAVFGENTSDMWL